MMYNNNYKKQNNYDNNNNSNDDKNLYLKRVTQSNYGKDLPFSRLFGMFTSSPRAPGLQSSRVHCF